jgi:hypothetical protein
MTRRGLTGVLTVVLVAAPAPAAPAHDGPPFPIVQNRLIGAYDLSIWTDPDSTDDGTAAGKFWVVLAPSDGAREISQGTQVRVAVRPLDRPGAERAADAAPVDGKVSRQYAALLMDHEGRFGVRVTVEGPAGRAEIDSIVEATYDLRPAPFLVVVYALPFVAIGLLWMKVLLRRRRGR